MNVQSYSDDNICSAIACDMYRRFKCQYSVIIKISTDCVRDPEELVQKIQMIAERHKGLISRAHILTTRYLTVGISEKEEAIIFTRECHSNGIRMHVVAECWDKMGNPVSVEPTPLPRKRKSPELS